MSDSQLTSYLELWLADDGDADDDDDDDLYIYIYSRDIVSTANLIANC